MTEFERALDAYGEACERHGGDCAGDFIPDYCCELQAKVQQLRKAVLKLYELECL